MKYNMYGQPEYMPGDVRPEHAVSRDIRPVGLPKGAVYQHATGGAVHPWELRRRNESNNIQLAQNSVQMNDAGQYNPNGIADSDLYSRMWRNIKEYEDVKPYPYLDSKGYITTGGGANINDINDFMKVNFTVDGIPATSEQKLSAYNMLRQMSNEKDMSGKYINRNFKAQSFEPYTNVRISDDEAYRLAYNHMTGDLSHVRQEFSDFDRFPIPLKEVLLDIQYNTGNLNERNWPNLYRAIHDRDVWGENGIVNNVHRKDVQQRRNDWARKKAQSIRF